MNTTKPNFVEHCVHIQASFRVIFGAEQPADDHTAYLASLIKAVESELLTSDKNAARCTTITDDTPDSIDFITLIAEDSEDTSLAEHLERLIWLTLLNKKCSDEDIEFYAQHAARLCNLLPVLLNDHLLPENNQLSRLSPRVSRFIKTLWEHGFETEGEPATASNLRERSRRFDQFYQADAFRYLNGTFYETKLESVKPVNEFYGFSAIRQRFQQYFENFAKGEPCVPLLISSLPGLGKTQFTVSYTKAHQNLTLILPEPSALEDDLEHLISALARRTHHRFVIFFDDIDTATVNWFHFRTHVGGCLPCRKTSPSWSLRITNFRQIYPAVELASHFQCLMRYAVWK